jgi:hypothetical protein
LLGKLEKYYYGNCFGKDKCSIKIDTSLDKLGVIDNPISSGGSTSTKDNTDKKGGSTGTKKPDTNAKSDPAKKPDPNAKSDPAKKPDPNAKSDPASKPSATKTDPNSSSSKDPKAKSDQAAKPGGSRLLETIAWGSLTPKSGGDVDEIDMLSDLSPVCKRIILGRVYESKYTSKPIKDKIKSSSVKIQKTTGVVAPEPWLIFMAKCQQTTIVINQRGYSFSFKKEDLGIIVIFIDFAVILCFIYFVFFLN